MRKVLLVLIVLSVVVLLMGCCCCPTCPQPQTQFKPEIYREEGEEEDYEESYCIVLEKLRIVTREAKYRRVVKPKCKFTSVSDTQKVIDKIGTTGDMIARFLDEPGCDELLFGHFRKLGESEYEHYVTAVMNFEDGVIEFYEVTPDGDLVRMYPNDQIDAIILY